MIFVVSSLEGGYGSYRGYLRGYEEAADIKEKMNSIGCTPVLAGATGMRRRRSGGGLVI